MNAQVSPCACPFLSMLLWDPQGSRTQLSAQGGQPDPFLGSDDALEPQVPRWQGPRGSALLGKLHLSTA